MGSIFFANRIEVHELLSQLLPSVVKHISLVLNRVCHSLNLFAQLAHLGKVKPLA